MGLIIECTGKVICVESPPSYPFTIGKIYEYVGTVFHQGTGVDCYVLRDDSDNLGWYDKSIFVKLEEYRENKLKKLIDE